MTSFVDSAGRPWCLDINVASVKRLRARLGVDLLAIFTDAKVLESIYSDPVYLIDIVYVLCEKQAQVRGMHEEDFGVMFSGELIEAARKALLDDILNFIESRQDRESYRKILTAMEERLTAARQYAAEIINSGTIEQKMDAELRKLKDSFFDSQAL